MIPQVSLGDNQRHFSSLGVVGGFSGGQMIFRVNGG